MVIDFSVTKFTGYIAARAYGKMNPACVISVAPKTGVRILKFRVCVCHNILAFLNLDNKKDNLCLIRTYAISEPPVVQSVL
jgi:hypothetical protein